MVRRPELPLFALILGVYAYFYQAGGWNQNSRFDLTRAIVERGTVAIDAFHENTGDKAERDGHWYSDKAPGLSWLAVPAYAAVHLVRPRALVAGSYAATVFAVSLPSALAALLLFRLGRRLDLDAAWSAAITVAYALGTLALPYSTLLYGHQLAAALGFSAFALIEGGHRAILAGALLGAAVCVDYTSVLVAFVVGAYAAARHGRRYVALLVAGATPAALVLAAYHAAAFGHALALPYDYVLQEHRRTGWFMGVARPDPVVLRELLVGAYRGLFYATPWMAACVPGLVFLYRQGRRAEAVVCGTVAALFLLLNAGLADWHGGWALGPRYLVPAIPFLTVGAMGLVPARAAGSAGRRALAAIGAMTVAFSIMMMLAGTAVRPEVPLTVRRPFQDYVFPLLARGRLARSNQSIDSEGGTGGRTAWNLGHALGLEGAATLLPLALWMGLTSAWLAVSVANSRKPPPHER
jgi:hypothetical protein